MHTRFARFFCATLLAVSTAQTGAWSLDSGAQAEWAALKREGDTAFSANNYGLAERSLTQALKEADKLGPNDLRLADTLHSLVNLYSTRGQFAKAEPLFERELRVREKALGGENPQVVDMVGKLAQFYLSHGSPAKADKLCGLLVAFADRRLKEERSVQDEFSKLNRYYEKSKSYAEAQTLLGKLETVTDRTTANENLELATALDSLGHVYQSSGKFEIAEHMFKNALAFREHTLSENHLALAYSYENLGNLYQAQGKTAQAEGYFKKSLDVTEKTLQPGRPEVFKRVDELAQSYAAAGHIGEAESLYKRALAVMEKSGNRGDIGRASLALGTLYIKQGRYGQSEPLIKRALLAAESVNGPQHMAVALILDTYAEVLEKISKNGEAARMRARARSIRGTTVEKADAGSDF